MTKKKKAEAKKVFKKSSEDKLREARERRIKRASLNKQEIEENVRDEFRKYFSRIKRELNLPKEMEHVIWLHFKACKFDKKSKFREGIEHFGYKLK